MTLAEQKKRTILIGFACLLLLHMIFVFSGFYNNDDIKYAKYAAKLADEGITFTPAISHYAVRWTVISITALFYKVFGTGSFTSLLCSFLSLFFCGWLLHRMMRNYKPGVYFLSMLFFFFAHSIIFYMHRLLPDPLMCLIVFWMYLSYRSYSLYPERPIWHGLQFALAFILAVITKETIIIVIPLFALFFIKDVFVKKQFAFWKYAASLSVSLLFLYLLYFKVTTGSFFYRYQLLKEGSYFSGCSYDVLPFISTVKRIGYELWLNLLLNGDQLIFLPALAAVLYRKKLALQTGLQSIDAFSFLVMVLSANFMTISFTSYVPLCPDPRHFLFLFPLAAFLAGPVLYAYFEQPKQFPLLPLLLLAATIIMFGIKAGNTRYIYLLFSFLLLIRYFLPDRKESGFNVRLCSLLFAVIFLINYLTDFVRQPYPYYWDQKKLTEEMFAGKQVPATLFPADDFSGEMTKFFLGYKTGNLRILPLDSARTVTGGNLYYLLAGDLKPFLQPKVDSILSKSDHKNFSLVRREGNTSLYKTDARTLEVLAQFYTKEMEIEK